MDLTIRGLTDDRVDGREFKHPTARPLGEVEVLDPAWDEALLAVVDEDASLDGGKAVRELFS